MNMYIYDMQAEMNKPEETGMGVVVFPELKPLTMAIHEDPDQDLEKKEELYLPLTLWQHENRLPREPKVIVELTP